MRLIQAPLSSAVGVIAQAVPNQVGNFSHTVPREVGNFAQTVPSSVGNGDGPSNEFVGAKGCRCAVLLTILFGGIVIGFIALQTPKVKPVETEPPSTTVFCISGRPVKNYADASTQKSPMIIFADCEPKRPEEPTPENQVTSSEEDQKSSMEDTNESSPCSSETSCSKSEGSDEKILDQDKSVCEAVRKSSTLSTEEPAKCACDIHNKDQEDSCIKPRKRKTKKRKRPPSQTASAGPPSETGSISRSRSPKDRRRSRTSDDPRLSRGSRPGSYTPTRSRPRARRKAKK